MARAVRRDDLADVGDDRARYVIRLAARPYGYLTLWNGSAFVSTCSADAGVQKLSLLVTSTDNRAKESLNVIIRMPCRAADKACT